jgi:ABC-type transport system substrate-binding protein
MAQRRWFVVFTFVALALPFAAVSLAGTPTPGPEAILTVAVATFSNERWLPQLYVGAEDVVLKPMYENLLSRDPKTGELIPLLAERREVLDGGRTWRFYLRKGISFHVKRRPVDRAIFAADFRARAYSGGTLAYAAPLVAPELWEVLIRSGYSKAALSLFMEHSALDGFIERLAVQPDREERVWIMREEMLPWLREYIPGVAIGATHTIAGVGPRVGEWPLIPGYMGFHNWEYVTRAR